MFESNKSRFGRDIAPYEFWTLSKRNLSGKIEYVPIVEVVSFPSDGRIHARKIPGIAASVEWFSVKELEHKIPKQKYLAIFEATSKILNRFPVDMIRYLGNAGLIPDMPNLFWHCGVTESQAKNVVEDRWKSFGWQTKIVKIVKI